MYALADWFAEPPLDPPLNLYGSYAGTWVVITANLMLNQWENNYMWYPECPELESALKGTATRKQVNMKCNIQDFLNHKFCYKPDQNRM